jgi:flagellar protein FlaF
MGFGVSGSMAIIFLGVLIATGTLFTTLSATAEDISDARDERQERLLDRRNTDIDVTSAVYNTTSGTLNLTVSNEGATTLSVNGTTLLVDNQYHSLSEATVDGLDATDLWEPGETLALNVSMSQPVRVKVVSEQGVADTDEVTVT